MAVRALRARRANNMAEKKRVLWWGRFDPGYSRNRVYIALFKRLGWEVDFFFVKVWPRFGDVEAFFRGPSARPDLVWVPVCRQRDILAACRWAHRRNVPVIFDPMISAWDKKVLEQQKWDEEERRAKRLLALEKKMMSAPDIVTCDTSCHADFFAATLGVPRGKLRVLFTGTDEKVFVPQPPRARKPGEPFKVLYHGAYLPLHGTEYIVEAARMTQNEPVEWNFLGWGAYKAATEAKAAGLRNVRFLEKVPYVQVPSVIGAHDVVFGVFGTTEKASRVIGNKVYEAMACSRPVVNEFCSGYPPEAADCRAIKFIPPGDPRAIADAVRAYRAAEAELPAIDAEARAFFDAHLSMKIIEKQLESIISDPLLERNPR